MWAPWDSSLPGMKKSFALDSDKTLVPTALESKPCVSISDISCSTMAQFTLSGSFSTSALVFKPAKSHRQNVSRISPRCIAAPEKPSSFKDLPVDQEMLRSKNGFKDLVEINRGSQSVNRPQKVLTSFPITLQLYCVLQERYVNPLTG
jgi:hypothetical protein